MKTLEKVLDTLVNWATNTGIKIVIALVILLISFRIITVFCRKLQKNLIEGKHPVDKTLAKTFAYLLKLVLKIVVLVCLIGYLGFDTSAFTAIIASLGVCAGLAVNGALSNLAGGALILITRPFRVDDFIEAQGYSGVVEDIHIVNTRIRTGDNKVIYIPNGALSSGSIVNYSVKDLRRVDFTFAIDYSNDFEKAKQIVMDVCTAHPLVLDDPEPPMVRVSEHGANSINLVTRVWVKSTDYWTVNFDILEAVKKAFDTRGITIPYSQLDVHIKKD